MSEASAKQKAALWVGTVFLLGAALGGVLGYLFAHRSVSAANPPLSEPERRARRVADLTRELSLTPQQAQQLDAVLLQRHTDTKAIHDQADAQLEQIRHQTDAQLDQIREKGRAQVRAILTPEQMPKFEEFLKRMDEQRKRAVAPPTH
jgi:Spy/CpxP family protein refolding chaperone